MHRRSILFAALLLLTHQFFFSPTVQAQSVVNLAGVTTDTVIQDGQTLTGTLGTNVKISIADGATVTLDGVSINADGGWTAGGHAGLTCLGNATLLLVEENTLKGLGGYPAIKAAKRQGGGEEYTLTISGSGVLAATGGVKAAAIGSGETDSCGNIHITGGTISAIAGNYAAGIGAGKDNASCGDIRISDGSVTATGKYAAGIGAGNSNSSCGAIYISGGVVTATGGMEAAGIGSGKRTATCGNIYLSGGTVTATSPYVAAGIGAGRESSCGDIYISGGIINATGDYAAGIGSGYSNSSCGNIRISGGSVFATGGTKAPGIGSGCDNCSCGNITILDSVTALTAYKGSNAPNAIGSGGLGSTCGTITICGVVYWDGSSYQNGGDDTENGIVHSPYQYPPSFNLDSIPLGWTVTVDGVAVPLTPYTQYDTHLGYATAAVGATVTVIPDDSSSVCGVKVRRRIMVNGHEAIPFLGNTLWATSNIGANDMFDVGGYYSWGELTPKSTYMWENYSFGNIPSGGATRYASADTTTLIPEDDVAHATWDSLWRMPTKTEAFMLFRRNNAIWVNNYKGTGKNGRLIVSTNGDYAGNTIFIPAAGYRDTLHKSNTALVYWTTTLQDDNIRHAHAMYSIENGQDVYGDGRVDRCLGLPVRPALVSDSLARLSIVSVLCGGHGDWNFTMPKDGAVVRPMPCSTPELAWSRSEDTIIQGLHTSTPSTLTNPHNLPVRYGSSNPSVATIDNMGSITVNDYGTTTIYAIHNWFNGDGYSYDSVAYTLHVIFVDTLTLVANSAEGGSVAVVSNATALGGGRYAAERGTAIQTRATANTCYRLLSWSNGAASSNNNVTLNGNLTLTATFQRDTLQSDTSATANHHLAWHGTDYTVEGDYHDTLTTAQGCDSVVTLHLTLTHIDTLTLAVNDSLLGSVTLEYFHATDTVLLDTVSADYTALDGQVLTGTINSSLKLYIAADASVMLRGATIKGTDNSVTAAAITLLGNATLVLADSTTNDAQSLREYYPGIQIPVGSTLTIRGNGTLNASATKYAAGIGGAYQRACGAIVIESGTINTNGHYSPGIGGGYQARNTSGNITIHGGILNSTNIGSNYLGSIDSVTITGGVVNITGGNFEAGIGAGHNGTCNHVLITGGTINVSGGWYGAGIGSGQGGNCKEVVITGGIIHTTAGYRAASIGGGDEGKCGSVTIASSVTLVTAKKDADCNYTIGPGLGNSSTCGIVTIGGQTGYITSDTFAYQGQPQHTPTLKGYPVSRGTEVVVRATPYVCNHLSSWSDGAAITPSNTNTLTVSGNMTLTANFERNTATTRDTTATAVGHYLWHGVNYTLSGNYPDSVLTAEGCDSIITLHLTIVPFDTLTLAVNDTAMGSVTLTPNGSVSNLGGGVYAVPRNTQIEVKATPSSGFLLHGWSDGTPANAFNTNTFVMSGNATLTANFEHNPVRLDSIPASWTVTVNGQNVPVTPYTQYDTHLGYAYAKPGAAVSIKVNDSSSCSQVSVRRRIMVNGHECIPMGDSLLWSVVNMGADSVHLFGDYYAWGETTAKASFSNLNYNCPRYTSSDTLNLVASDDAAQHNWGGLWRMPTDDDWNHLTDLSHYTINRPTNFNYHGTGVDGMVITRTDGPYAGNTLFLPAAGFVTDALHAVADSGVYWSSSINSNGQNGSVFLSLLRRNLFGLTGCTRWVGASVRPMLVSDSLANLSIVDMLSQGDSIWTFTMPTDSSVVRTVPCKDPELAWNRTTAQQYLGVGGSQAMLINPSKVAVRYGSTDTTVATVNSIGFVKPHSLGTTTIYAVHDNGLKDGYFYDSVVYTLTVLPADTLTLVADPTAGGTVEQDIFVPKDTILLDTLTSDYYAKDGDVLTGTLGPDYDLSVESHSKVVLAGVIVNSNATIQRPGIYCRDNVTLILGDGTENILMGTNNYGVISSGKITLCGNGSLTAIGHCLTPYSSSASNNAGIGVIMGLHSSIFIQSGNITAIGAYNAPGIGTPDGLCEKIAIQGGNITAIGGDFGPGIGAGGGIVDSIIITGGAVMAISGIGSQAIGVRIASVGGVEGITIDSSVTSVTAFAIESFREALGTTTLVAGQPIYSTDRSFTFTGDGTGEQKYIPPVALGGNRYLVAPGAQVVAKAKANTCYHLASWSTGDTLNSDGTDTIIVNGNTTLTAHFERDTVYDEFSAMGLNQYTWNGTQYTTSGDYLDTIITAKGCANVTTMHLTIVPADTLTLVADPAEGGSVELDIFVPKDTILLDTLTSDYYAKDGDVLTGTLDTAYYVVTDSHSKVMLAGVTIENNSYGLWVGDTATIILADGTNNILKAPIEDGFVGLRGWTDLTIEGNGSLTAIGSKIRRYISDSTGAAGIWGSNITINGGNITAIGGLRYAGIDGEWCPNLTINGGNITAIGGDYCAGIGGFFKGILNQIIINGGTVTAIGGINASGINFPANALNIDSASFTISDAVNRITAIAGGPNIPAIDSKLILTMTAGGQTISNTDSIFTFTGNGTGERKYIQPVSLGDGRYLVAPGARVVAKAKANTCYHLDSWSNGDTVNADYTDTIIINGNTTLTAHFLRDTTRSDTTASAIGHYVWHGEDYRVSGDYDHTYQTVQQGCDSVVTLHLTVTPVDTLTLTANYTWMGFITAEALNGLSNSGVEDLGNGLYAIIRDTQVVVTATANTHYHLMNWSDSTRFISFNDVPPTHSGLITLNGNLALEAQFASNLYTVTAEVNDPMMGNTMVTYHGQVGDSLKVDYDSVCKVVAIPATCYHFTGWSNGETNDTILLHPLGDTTVRATFERNAALQGDTTAVACENFTWRGSDYTATPNVAPTFELSNADGCDSIVTLHLTVNYSSTGDTTATACNRFNWYEHTNLTSSCDNLTHLFANSNVHNCDSTVTLHLTVNYSTTGDTTATACDNFNWHEYSNITNSSENLTHLFPLGNARHCDSTVTLHLTVNYSTTGDTTARACDSFNWYEHTGLTASSQNLTHLFANGNARHCDSTVTLHLTVHYRNTGDTNAVEYAPFTWYEHRNMTSSQTVTHRFRHANQWHCDSTVTLHLRYPLYLTNWTGNDTVVYTALPQTGISATYIDDTNATLATRLTFIKGTEVIRTPNYPVNAGTYTVIARALTTSPLDSLLSSTTTFTILPAKVTVEGATVKTVRFEDSTTTAKVTSKGTLQGVLGNDRVRHTVTANYAQADPGTDIDITLSYALTGRHAPNYYLDPDSDVVHDGVILEQYIPDSNGFEADADGYCAGPGAIRYMLRRGQPDQYKLTFSDPRISDIDWNYIVNPGIVDIEVPDEIPMGDYNATLYLRNSLYPTFKSGPIAVTFHVNLPKSYIKPLFRDIIALVDTCHCFTEVQWYHRNEGETRWTLIPDANDYYYCQTGGLTGEYRVHARMNGVETFICPQDDMLTLIADRQVTVTAYPNPTTSTVQVNISNSDQDSHLLRVYSTTGLVMESRVFDGDNTTIDMTGYHSSQYVISVDGIIVKVVKR